METAIIKKILNNNVVIAERNNEDLILIGKGIGFDFPKGSKIPKDRIEKVFIKENRDVSANYEKVLMTIDSNIIGISEEIIFIAEGELGTKLNETIHVSLPDHINFAIRRIHKGLRIENPFLYEIKILYPKEYSIATKAVNMINTGFNVMLPEDEIGFICLHIRAAMTQEPVGTSFEYTKKIGNIMDLIRHLLKKQIDNNSLEYARTVIHINFLLERILTGKTIKNLLLDTIKKQLCSEYSIAIKVAMKIENLFSVKVPDDEIGYLALHIKRLTEI